MTIFGILGGYLWLAFIALHPKLPSPEKPLILYSNHLRQDLKLTLLQALKKAQTSILLYIYELSDPSILLMLSKKQSEGVEMAIFHDKKRTLSKKLPAHPVKTGGLMHRKILILDDETTFLGSANFTTQSLKMHDNLILGLWDPAIAKFFKQSSESEGKFECGGIQIRCFLLPDLSGEAINALERALNEAEQSIQVAMFTLTHCSIINRLVEAQKRGVRVSVAIDRYTAKGASKEAVEKLLNAQTKIFLNRGNQLLHHKWAMIDGKTLILGSANWTKAAFAKNHDCLLILNNIGKAERKSIESIWRGVENGSEKM